MMRLLYQFGIKPDVTMGHSLGEYGAAVAAGILSFEDALKAVTMRGSAMAGLNTNDNGKMAAVAASADKVEPELRKISGYSKIKGYLNIDDSEINPYINASCIISLKEKDEGDGLFSTHPSVKNRIKILSLMCAENLNRADYISYNKAYYSVTKQKNIIPKSALKNAKKIEIAQGANAAPIAAIASNLKTDNKADISQQQKQLNKHRAIEDMMWKLADYTIIQCSCNTKLKIPPSFKNKKITCPHCKKVHIIE